MATSTRFAPLTRKQRLFVSALQDAGITTSPVSRTDLLRVSQAQGMAYPPAWIAQDKTRRAARGEYLIPEVESVPTAAPVVGNGDSDSIAAHAATLLAATGGERSSFVPTPVGEYVPFGHFDDLTTIVKAGLRKTNVWVTGLSGNGKTMMVEQVCAALNRECIRVQITNLTDEDDLFGGWRLVNGQTVWQDGPVILALERGAVLLLDEIDYGTSKLSCLQSVLEGNGAFIKQTNRKVLPAKGFMCIATANTKGQGDSTGKFIGTNAMNEALLERFAVTLEQGYAPLDAETKMLEKKMTAVGISVDSQFIDCLTKWADNSRKTFEAEGGDALVTTRRLVNIIELYAVFNDKEKAIRMAIARFSPESKEALWQTYTKFDASTRPAADPKAAAAAAAAAAKDTANPNDCPF